MGIFTFTFANQFVYMCIESVFFVPFSAARCDYTTHKTLIIKCVPENEKVGSYSENTQYMY